MWTQWLAFGLIFMFGQFVGTFDPHVVYVMLGGAFVGPTSIWLMDRPYRDRDRSTR